MVLRRLIERAVLIAVLALVVMSIAPLGAAPRLAATLPSPFLDIRDGPRTMLPAAIDTTGATDASAAILTFLTSVSDGSTIVFRPGTYRLDRSIRLDARHGLTFEGAGARLQIAGCEIDDSAFVIDNGTTDIAIRDLTINGDNEQAGTSGAFTPGCEAQAGVAIYSGANVEISGVTIGRTWGDCVYVDAGGDGAAWSDGVWFHDSVCAQSGRMGVAITAARRVLVESVRFQAIGMFVLDIEPYRINGGGTHVTFRHNTVEGYGLSPLHTNWFVAAEGETGSLVQDLTVTDNVVTAGAPHSSNTITDAGLATSIRVERRQRVIFSNNSTTVPGSGPVLFFSHIDGLIVSGNTQPLLRGSLAWFRDCSSVDFDGVGPSS